MSAATLQSNARPKIYVIVEAGGGEFAEIPGTSAKDALERAQAEFGKKRVRSAFLKPSQYQYRPGVAANAASRAAIRNGGRR